MSRHRSLATQLGFGSRGTKPTPAPAPETKPRAVRPIMPSVGTGIDAMALSPDDYERRLDQLGLSAPSADHRRLQPPGDPEAQRAAARDLDRAGRRVARGQARELEARTAAVSAGSIDARNASPEEVRARMASLGFEATDLTVRPVGRALDPTKDQSAGLASQMQRDADREVARHVLRATQAGQSVDAKKLTSGELRALLELRGAGL